jgi:hypothetical protein
MVRDMRENVAMLLATLVAVFIIGTLAVVFILALNGVALPDTWDSLFGLVIAVMSALGGWLVGKNSITNVNEREQS